MTDALYNDPEIAALYDWHNPWPAAYDWFLGLAEGARVLDLGCGTGIFSLAMARRGQAVTGADPARAMLDLARAKPEGGLVRWVEADARSLDLGERFDLVCMTGHAFQTLLTEADRAAGLATIARHLSPGGRFFFDSRNPLAQEWRDWTERRSREATAHPEHGMVQRWTEAGIDPATGIVTYTTEYRFASGRALTARSPIAFAPQEELARLIAAAGLVVEHWYGNTEGAPYTEASPEIIPVGTLS